jgi:E3 ubiquitin-protein ligase BRE1
MQEYSRKATIAESRLEEIHKRSVHHDDHLRVVDAWLGQVLDEMELLVNAKVSTTSAASGKPRARRSALEIQRLIFAQTPHI